MRRPLMALGHPVPTPRSSRGQALLPKEKGELPLSPRGEGRGEGAAC